MLDEKKIQSAQRKLSDKSLSTKRYDRFTELISRLQTYLQGESMMDLRTTAVFEQIGHGFRSELIASCTTVEERQMALSLISAAKMYHFDLMRHGIKTNTPVFSNFSFHVAAGMDVPLFQSIGWFDYADELLQYVWTEYAESKKDDLSLYFGQQNSSNWVNENANPYLSGKYEWFTTMSGFKDDNIWKKYGYDPDAESLGAFADLLEVWDSPDVALVNSALVAVRELNVATAIKRNNTEGAVVYIVDNFLLQYDYDIRSINMRRKELGLEIVEVPSYIYDMQLPLTALPFAIDTILYPSYVKMCEEMKVAPINPMDKMETIEVLIDTTSQTIKLKTL